MHIVTTFAANNVVPCVPTDITFGKENERIQAKTAAGTFQAVVLCMRTSSIKGQEVGCRSDAHTHTPLIHHIVLEENAKCVDANTRAFIVDLTCSEVCYRFLNDHLSPKKQGIKEAQAPAEVQE